VQSLRCGEYEQLGADIGTSRSDFREIFLTLCRQILRGDDRAPGRTPAASSGRCNALIERRDNSGMSGLIAIADARAWG
jgi:hypothetical protein